VQSGQGAAIANTPLGSPTSVDKYANMHKCIYIHLDVEMASEVSVVRAGVGCSRGKELPLQTLLYWRPTKTKTHICIHKDDSLGKRCHA
jgi:hypothetical protein